MKNFIIKTPKQHKVIKTQFNNTQISNGQYFSSRIAFTNINEIKKQIENLKLRQTKRRVHTQFIDQMQFSNNQKLLLMSRQKTNNSKMQKNEGNKIEFKKYNGLNNESYSEENNLKLSTIIQSKRKINNFCINLNDQQTDELPNKPKSVRSNKLKQINNHFLDLTSIQNNNFQTQISHQPRQNIKPRKNGKIKQSKIINQISQYEHRINILKQIYQYLSIIIQNIKKNYSAVLRAAHKYVQLIKSNKYLFIDSYIDQQQIKTIKALKTLKYLQFVSIFFLFLQLAQKNIQQNVQNMTNIIGYASSNQIFFIKLFILAHKSQIKNIDILQFQTSIKQFQLTNFKKQLITQQQILSRILHNNQTLQILNIRIGKSNQKFYGKIKDFFKSYQRQKISSSQAFRYMLQYLSFYFYQNKINGKIPYLDVAPSPYLTNKNINHTYTLVIQPCNVLYYYKSGKYYVRTHTYQFLKFAKQNFEVVFWTNLMPKDVQNIFNIIDPDSEIFLLLYRYHCRYDNEYYVKDIKRLGREIKNVMMIDSNNQSFGNISNGINMNWRGSQRDGKLLNLMEFLRLIVENRLSFIEGLRLFESLKKNMESSNSPQIQKRILKRK